jgi:hypothetical protein
VHEGVAPDCAADGSLVAMGVRHASRKTDMRRLAMQRLPFLELEAA